MPNGAMTHFHGSISAIQEPYRALTHFGTRTAAMARALHHAHRLGETAIWLQEVRLDVHRPLMTTDIGQHSVIKMIDHLHYDHRPRRERVPTSARNAVFEAMQHGREDVAFAEAIRACGWDGLGYVNVHEDSGSTSLIVLDGDQVATVGAPVRMEFDAAHALVRAAHESRRKAA